MSGVPLPPLSTIGILGGGQLGRMLGMAAARLGYRTILLDPDPFAPAAQTCSEHIVAAYDDEAALERLAAADAVTYEFENVPLSAAKFLDARTMLAPSPRSLAVSQDRIEEKAAIAAMGPRVAEHRPVDGEADLQDARSALGSIVLKTRRLGYDGKGQRVLPKEAGDAKAAEALSALGGRDLIAEALVTLDAEVSVIVVRARDGEAVTFDPARNEHEGGILVRSTVPMGLGGAIEREAREAAIAIAEGLGHVGAMGVEFFVSDGALLVNEIAPRVHNTGHWTEAACAIDQFEAHIRAVAGLPLGNGARHSDAVMENLIGADVERFAALAADPLTRVHLYGKAAAREGRKMGHATAISPRTGS